MKDLKTGFVVAFAVIFSIACGMSNEPANKNATPKANTNASNAGQVAAVANTNQSAVMEGGNGSLNTPKKESSSTDTAKVFGEKCAMCHGENGKGITKGTPDLTNAAWQKKETDAEFADMIKVGKKPMPAFGDKLSDEQIKALVQYVRGFAKK